MRRAFLVAAIVFAAPLAAGAEEPIRADCLPHVTPAEQRTYDDQTHRNWYRRYWNGSCAGLSFWCSSGKPYWNDSIATMIAENPQLEAAEILSRACPLGELVGYEWAKDNSVRCIDTRAVEAWNDTLTNPADLFATLDSIRQQATARLGCR